MPPGRSIFAACAKIHLAVGAAARGVGVPFVARFRLAAEHALAGAGRVHQNAVENAGKRGASASGIALSTTALRTPMRSMLRERICARLGMGSLQQSSPRPAISAAICVLLPPGGAKVEHPLAGLGIERGDGGPGRSRLLHVKQAALVQRRQAGARRPRRNTRPFAHGTGAPSPSMGQGGVPSGRRSRLTRSARVYG